MGITWHDQPGKGWQELDYVLTDLVVAGTRPRASGRISLYSASY